MLKKCVCSLLAILMVASLTGCGNDYSDNNTQEATQRSTRSEEEKQSIAESKVAEDLAKMGMTLSTTAAATESAAPESEEQFKANCKDYTYDNFSTNPRGLKGSHIVKECEIVGYAHDQNSNEQYLECQYKSITENGLVSYVSKPFYVKNYSDKGDFKIYDLITVYGLIEEVSQSTTWKGGTSYNAIIDAKYIDYNGVFGK